VLPTSSRTEEDFSAALTTLREVGLIDWYDSSEGQVIEITDFDLHQTGLHKRTASKFPGKFPELPESTALTELNRTELNRTEGAPAPAVSRAPVLAGTFPRDHIDHRFCGRFCVTAKTFVGMATQYGEGGDAAVTGFLQKLSDGLDPGKSHGGPLWVMRHFEAFLIESGRVEAPPVAKIKSDWKAQVIARDRARGVQ
jgi:hypothetical protein